MYENQSEEAEMSAQLKAGVIGLGILGSQHAQFLNDQPEVTVAAVADILRERSQEIGGRVGAQPYTDYERMLKEQRLDIASEIQQALLDLQRERERIELSQEGIVSAQEDLRYAQESYRLGAGTILEVLDAQAKLTDARNAQTGALYDYQLARLRLDRARGEPGEGKE